MKIRDAIYCILKHLINQFASATKTGTQTISANSSAIYTLDFAKTGYKPIGVKRLQNDKGGTVEIRGFWWDGDNLKIFMLNNGSSQSVNCYAEVVYAKEKIFGGGINPLVSTLSALVRGCQHEIKRYALCFDSKQTRPYKTCACGFSDNILYKGYCKINRFVSSRSDRLHIPNMDKCERYRSSREFLHDDYESKSMQNMGYSYKRRKCQSGGNSGIHKERVRIALERGCAA